MPGGKCTIPFFHHRIHCKIHILAVSQQYPYHISSLLQERGNVIGYIIYPPVKLTLTRFVQVLRNRLSVHRCRKKPQAADIEPGLRDCIFIFENEIFRKGRSRRFITVKIISLTDPDSLPVLFLQQPHLIKCRFTPG